jgi:hypothetical protein
MDQDVSLSEVETDPRNGRGGSEGRCARNGCANAFLRKPMGRPREFCSEKCRRLHWQSTAARTARARAATAPDRATPGQRQLVTELISAVEHLTKIVEALRATWPGGA